MKFILGKKIGMSQTYDEKGDIVPVTLIEAGPCFVLQKKTEKKDGYSAFQIGFQKIEKKSKIKKTMKGKEYKYIREFRMQDTPQESKPRIAPAVIIRGKHPTGQAEYNIQNTEIKADIFKEGDKVKISGISKGKGFQGAVKRWGFSGRNATHGVKHEHRTLGSVGMSFPERVIKGRKMPGRMGSDRVTIKNLEIAKVDSDNNLIAIKGAVPGHKGTLLEITG